MDQTQLMFLMSNMRSKSGMNTSTNDEVYRRMFIYLIEGVMVLLMTSVFNEFISYMRGRVVSYWKTIQIRVFKKTSILLEGFQESYSSLNTLRYCSRMNALGYYVYRQNIINKIRITENEEFLLDTCVGQILAPDIYLDVNIKDHGTHIAGANSHMITRIVSYYTIYSYKLSYTQLENFLAKITSEYEFYLENNNHGKQYHFIFSKIYNKSESKETPIFHKSLIIDGNNPSYGSYETFDNIFSENKDQIIRDVIKLSDKQYFSKNGLKCKKGYLFHGHPGCGKTSFVMAIAHLAKRHIIEIPLSRVKTNADFETILHTTNIKGVKINRENTIILFDEIDIGLEAMKKREKEDESSKKMSTRDGEKVDDKLSLDTLLSRLDGIGNYNGLIFIATTNYLDKIDQAIYRHGRLDPYHFDYCRQEDIINMTEKFYEIQLSQREKDMLPRKDSEITPATMKKYLCDHDTKDELLNFLQKSRE